MILETADWLIIISYFILSLGIGIYFTRKAGKNLTNFFLGGRNMSWWLAGVSMVATTFAADTPLAVTELVAQNGIAGNWIWWNALLGGMLTVFFFAKLWRRAEILTDIELIEMRYSGKEAAFLRGFRSIYLGLFMNAVVIGWVNLALISILEVFFNIPEDAALFYVAGAMVLTLVYSSLSGLLGVAVTDFIQFFIAFGGCIILAIIVVNSDSVGGIDGLKTQLPDWSMQFFPQIESRSLTSANIGTIGETLTISVATFVSFVGIQWWASWYPGAEPGGGGYIAQRMMSTKSEKDALLSTLFFQITHYCFRPWPWILVGLCTLILYPELPADDKKLGFIYAMRDFLPVGLRGLLLVAFFAAYMSTISTQLNWGASYLVNDFYQRFINKSASEKTLVRASRLATLLMMLFALFVTTQFSTIKGAWYFLLQASAGLGLVLILRWYWWRINAWSEIAATLVPLLVLSIISGINAFVEYQLVLKIAPENFPTLYRFHQWLSISPNSFFLITVSTTISWLTVTFLTPPTQKKTLIAFYEKIRPQGAWKPIRELAGYTEASSTLSSLALCWLLAIILTYSSLFLFGKLIFMEWNMFFIYLGTAVISGIALIKVARSIKVFED